MSHPFLKRSPLAFSLPALILSLLFLQGPTLLSAQGSQTIDSYIFGNSLVHHLMQVHVTPSEETSSPHWINFLAREAGHSFAIAGDFGLLPEASSRIPLENNWQFDSVPDAWDSYNVPFSQSQIDNVMITPTNFVQLAITPAQNYPNWSPSWDTTTSPITAADMIIKWTLANKPGTRIYIYEGWLDMDPYTNGNFPPSPTQWAAYQNDADFASDFHRWHVELHDSLVARNPNACIKLIPVGPLISTLLNRAPYNTMAVDSLYEDDAPHGRPSIYLLGGMIAYMAMYEEQAPLSYQAPAEFIDPLIISQYGNLVSEIWSELLAFNMPGGSSRVFCGNVTTGIEDNTIAVPDCHIYPNPASDRLYIQGGPKNGIVILRDLRGIVVLRAQLEGFIDVSSLSAGLYVLELQDQAGVLSTVKKVVIR